MATAIANIGTCEGARQSGVDVEKEWVCLGHNSRHEHASLNGYRVPIDGLFPLERGAKWPGDASLSARNTCNCNCRIDIVRSSHPLYRDKRTEEVADELGLEIYDEDKLDTAIYRCQQTIDCGGRLWEELTRQERSSVLDEIRTRDRDWVAFGRVPKVDSTLIDVSRLNEEQKRAFDKEMNCADALSLQGFRVSLIDDPNQKPPTGTPKLDYSIGEPGIQWEAKCPEGNGYLAVAGNIAKADLKFRKLGIESRIVISNIDSTMSDTQFFEFFYEALVDTQSDFSNVAEVLLVPKDGAVRRWTK